MSKKLKEKKLQEKKLKNKKKRELERKKLTRIAQDAKKVKIIQKLADHEHYGKPQPFIKDEAKREQIKKEKRTLAIQKLEKNMEILEHLEAQFEEEQALREKVNDQLDEEGCKTLREKMDFIKENAMELKKKIEELKAQNNNQENN